MAPALKPEKPVVTSSDVKHGLLKFYAPPAWKVFFEVANDTGSKVRRHIDAMAFGIWPSVGQEVVGIEVKVSRGDWLRELAQPAKAQELMKFCDRWYLAAPEGLVKVDELPVTWGLLELKADGVIKAKKSAPPLEPVPLSRGFLMAVMRQGESTDKALVNRLVAEESKKLVAQIEQRIESGVNARVRDNARSVEGALKVREKIKELTGTDLVDWNFDAEAFAAAYLFMKASSLHTLRAWGEGFPSALNQLEAAQRSIRKLYENPMFAEIRAALPQAKEEA